MELIEKHNYGVSSVYSFYMIFFISFQSTLFVRRLIDYGLQKCCILQTATLAEKVEVVPPVRAIGFDPARIGSSESEDGIVVYSPAELD